LNGTQQGSAIKFRSIRRNFFYQNDRCKKKYLLGFRNCLLNDPSRAIHLKISKLRDDIIIFLMNNNSEEISPEAMEEGKGKIGEIEANTFDLTILKRAPYWQRNPNSRPNPRQPDCNLHEKRRPSLPPRLTAFRRQKRFNIHLTAKQTESF